MLQFKLLATQPIPDLNAVLEQYVEPSTGARHVHLASSKDELAFLVAFPTVPQVSDGRAHILEHLVLCGSERFPVADPFFAMMRRSTATFMNAMTYADRTVYPFASTDRADFFNLLDVYLDATFFPKLDYLSFLQEGWRHTLRDGKLAYQGVVLNEMKGAFAAPMRALHQGINTELFEGTTYAVVSGGDPLFIPELSHQMLREFHSKHYHPSNAIFMSAGRVPAADIQARIEGQVLAKKSGRVAPRVPELAATWTAPRRISVNVPSQAGRDDGFGVQLAWRLGESKDRLAAARLELLGRGLLGNASAPVMKAMQSVGFGRPSLMNGPDDNYRQMAFHIGMAGLQEGQVDGAERLIRSALEKTAETGVQTDILQAALRDMRFGQREIQGGSMPDALGRMLAAVPTMMLDGDVAAAFDNEAALKELEKEIQAPRFFGAMVRDLLNTAEHVTARIVPDTNLAASRAQNEAKRLAIIEAALSDGEKAKIGEDESALAAHRQQRGNVESLPRIAPADVSREPVALPSLPQENGVALVEQPTNGITYANVVYNLSGFERSDWPWLALYCEVVPELGAADMDFEAASSWRSRKVPAFSMSLDTVERTDADVLTPELSVFSCGLSEQQAEVAEVIQTWTTQPRFDELQRIDFLVRARCERKLADLSEASAQYASLAATAGLSRRRLFSHELYGLPSLEFSALLEHMLGTPDGVSSIAEKLKAIAEQLQSTRRTVTWVASKGALAQAAQLLQPVVGSSEVTKAPGVGEDIPATANIALRFGIQVNHCYMAWAVPGMDDPDAAALAVAAELLSSRVLHRRIREEGGAYGGSAAYSSEDGVFVMSSFRDPRVAGTYLDFAASLDEALTTAYSQQALDEAIIGVIKRLDKPLAPYSEVMDAVKLSKRGVTEHARKLYRQRVLDCTLEEVKTAITRWLSARGASRVAAVGEAVQDLGTLEPRQVVPD